MARIYRNGVGYDTDRPIGFENNYEYDFNEGVLNSPTLDRAAGYAAVTPRVYTGADQAPGTRMGSGGDFRPYKPQDGRNYAPPSGLVRTENPVDSWRGMTRQQALNGGVGRVYDALAQARAIDERNHINETPTAAVGGRHYDVGSRDHFAAIAMDPSKSNFEREQARRQMETMSRMDRMDAENAAIRRAPPVILQPGVRAYREDGTLIGEGSAISDVPRGPVFGQRGVALPNENGGYSVEWAPLEQQDQTPYGTTPNGTIYHKGTGDVVYEPKQTPKTNDPTVLKPGEGYYREDGTWVGAPEQQGDAAFQARIDSLNNAMKGAVTQSAQKSLQAQIDEVYRQWNEYKAGQGAQQGSGSGSGRKKFGG